MKNKIIFLLLVFAFVMPNLWAQGIQEPTQASDGAALNAGTVLPLKKVVILTSGLAYYEHSGSVSGSANITIPFRFDAMNDALKTLVINDSASANPSVIYQAENTLVQTLRSLAIDLSDSPDLPTILSRLRGVEAGISFSGVTNTGRIAGIEYRVATGSVFGETRQPWLIFNTSDGIKSYNLQEITSIKFKESNIENDLNRALDLIASSRNNLSRFLNINLPGTSRRNVSISYVVPSPVWKVSYRLDLGASKPLFQGWAIVDNDSDTDWNNVELSLVAGRPTSFIQELYPPYYVSRPVQPLALAGTATAVTHDRSPSGPAGVEGNVPRPESQMMRMSMADEAYSAAPRAAPVVTGGTVQTAAGADAGGQFEFTIKNPVTLNRRMSAMLPLVEAEIEARGVLIYNGTGRYPRLGAEITNSSKMKLPAGPITVYDGGVYAGDALIEFWNEGEKRFISFGEDLSVTANTSASTARAINTVSVSGGVMLINNSITHSRTYTFLSSASVSKQMVIEHSRTSNTELVSPAANEQTAAIYRFNVTLPGGRETAVTVNERQIVSERITLVSQHINSLLSYSTNQEIPANVRTALTRAVELRRAVDAAETNVRTIEAQRNSLIADQDRVRRNLEAAGNQTQQGQEYLRRLVALDNEIDTAATNLNRANADVRAARTAFENYLNGLNLNSR